MIRKNIFYVTMILFLCFSFKAQAQNITIKNFNEVLSNLKESDKVIFDDYLFNSDIQTIISDYSTSTKDVKVLIVSDFKELVDLESVDVLDSIEAMIFTNNLKLENVINLKKFTALKYIFLGLEGDLNKDMVLSQFESYNGKELVIVYNQVLQPN
ncbi:MULTISPECIES: hypothetical protein [unclassified Myroides]|uniref:hypothetical protein n=1 Tax=unclassified Myroides TaxID=2642485 RepID=UPI003101A59B